MAQWSRSPMRMLPKWVVHACPLSTPFLLSSAQVTMDDPGKLWPGQTQPCSLSPAPTSTVYAVNSTCTEGETEFPVPALLCPVALACVRDFKGSNDHSSSALGSRGCDFQQLGAMFVSWPGELATAATWAHAISGKSEPQTLNLASVSTHLWSPAQS